MATQPEDKWTKIQTDIAKIDPTITPFVYGRYHQLVMDRSKFYKWYDDRRRKAVPNYDGCRREAVPKYIASRTPEQIVVEARSILANGSKKPVINDNGFATMAPEYPVSITNDESIYLGRCVQFLLDTDRKQYKLDVLLTWSADTLKVKAHGAKYNIYYEKYKHKEESCDCECECKAHDFYGGDFDCRRAYGEKGCKCSTCGLLLDNLAPVKSLDDVC